MRGATASLKRALASDVTKAQGALNVNYVD